MTIARIEDVAALATAFGADMGEVKPNVRKITTNATRAPLPADDALKGHDDGARWLLNGREWNRKGDKWFPVGDLTPLHFGTDPAEATRAALDWLIQSGGGRLVIPAGDHIVTTPINVVAVADLEIYFEPGAWLIAAPGLAQPVLSVRGAETDQPAAGDFSLRVINPQIDCSAGASPSGTGGNFCSALTFNYFRKVLVSGGALYGGELPDNANADSGISWVTCDDVVIDGVHIRGFNDCGIYPGGNNTTGVSGDGGPCKILNCLIQRCQSAVSAKREMDLLTFQGNTVEECLNGVSSQNVTDAGGVTGVRRLEVVNNVFRRIYTNVIRPRGNTKGVARGNTIIDWGFHPITMVSAGANAVAMNLDGTKGFDWTDNAFVLQNWTADNQIAVLFTQHSFNGVTYDHGKCFGSGNSYRGCPRVYGWAQAGGPHTMLDEYFEGVGATPISATNRHGGLVATYRRDGSDRLWSVVGGNEYPMGPPDVILQATSAAITSSHKNAVVTNDGATADITLTLPPAGAGVGPFTFSQLANFKIRVAAAAGDIIRLPGGVSSTAGGSVITAERGDFLTLVATDSTNWVCTAYGGAVTAL